MLLSCQKNHHDPLKDLQQNKFIQKKIFYSNQDLVNKLVLEIFLIAIIN